MPLSDEALGEAVVCDKGAAAGASTLNDGGACARTETPASASTAAAVNAYATIRLTL